MRNLSAVSILVLALGALVPVADGHGAGGFSHLSVDIRDLAPNQQITYHLTPEGEMEMITLTSGMMFLMYGGVTGPVPIVANLTFEGIRVAQFVWQPNTFSLNTTLLPFSGEYDVTLWNPSKTGTSRYAWYYDQSCNCKGKLIALEDGSVLFNYDLPAAKDVTLGFPLRANNEARATVAVLTGDKGTWPADFQLLTQNEARGPGWLNVSFRTQAADRYYVMVEAVDGASLDAPLELTPLLEVKAVDSPGPGLLALVGGLVVAGVLSRRRR